MKVEQSAVRMIAVIFRPRIWLADLLLRIAFRLDPKLSAKILDSTMNAIFEYEGPDHAC